jgi:hypothetical protein
MGAEGLDNQTILPPGNLASVSVPGARELMRGDARTFAGALRPFA